MYLANSGTHLHILLFKITKRFVHYICSQIICISNNFLKAPCARILKSKIKKLISSVKLSQLHKYNGKNHYKLRFIFFTTLEQNSLFMFELSSLVTLSKHWL